MKAFWDYLFKEWFRQVGEALLVAFLVTTFVFTTVGVVGQSMFPTLRNGERVLVPKGDLAGALRPQGVASGGDRHPQAP
jgi:signal peptidase I